MSRGCRSRRVESGVADSTPGQAALSGEVLTLGWRRDGQLGVVVLCVGDHRDQVGNEGDAEDIPTHHLAVTRVGD